jgi:beta-fructofuranosidase
MSLPRNYSTGEEERLLMSPAGDVESLRQDEVVLGDIELPANQEIVVDEVRGNAMEIIATIDPMEARYISVNVLRSADRSEYTAVNFHRDAGKDYANRSWGVRDSIVTIDPTFSTTGGAAEINEPQSCAFHYEEGELLELRIFVDRCIVEVFVNQQSACLTRVYPEGPDSVGFSIQARGHSAVCKKLHAWTMERIFL